MMALARRTQLALWLAIVLAIGIALLDAGIYGWMLFVIVPFALGLLAAWIARPATSFQAASVGAWAILGGCFLLVIFAFEGAVCIIMSLPIVLPLGCLGAWVGFRLQQAEFKPQQGAAMLVLPIAAFAWDINAPPPVFHVTTQVVVHATPEQVWKHVISFPKLPESREWIFRTGLAYPTEARIDGSGPGSVRYCRFSTGDFVEPITVWDEPRLLRFRVTQNPAPLQEWSPWGEIRPKHLHGYLISKQGQFQLLPFAGGRTLLTGTTWYRHSLWPAQYWRWWSDAIIHRIHARVLNHVRTLAEQEAQR
jgi:polyketide cyclase/dehydrase/lipid transport protein